LGFFSREHLQVEKPVSGTRRRAALIRTRFRSSKPNEFLTGTGFAKSGLPTITTT